METQKFPLWTVDAFTDQPFSGNPAAVVIIAHFPSDSLCIKIAKEMNLSETAFVQPLGVNRFHIRWFTPAIEVKLCGHATLAAAHVIYENRLASSDRLIFESLSGPLYVKKSNTLITLDFPLQYIEAPLPLLKTSGLFKETDIINVVRCCDDVIIEVSDETIVRNFQADAVKIRKIDCRGLILTAKGSHPYDFVSRFFAPKVGILEDPVTGSAHCKLADYWQKKLKKNQFIAYQASSRGGVIHIRVEDKRVLLQGKALTIIDGALRIPV